MKNALAREIAKYARQDTYSANTFPPGTLRIQQFFLYQGCGWRLSSREGKLVKFASRRGIP